MSELCNYNVKMKKVSILILDKSVEVLAAKTALEATFSLVKKQKCNSLTMNHTDGITNPLHYNIQISISVIKLDSTFVCYQVKTC